MARTVDCEACNASNPAWARFCAACGAAMELRCTHCRAPLVEGARFCPGCGAPADPGDDGPESDLPPEERRIATILFADLTGFTSVSESADPELVKSVVERGLRRLGAEITDHGGRIDKYIGDNVMGVFGAPEAHDDDPERAVRAGLAMQAAMQEVNRANPRTSDFSLRVGINTGEVMAGAVGPSYTVYGNSVNVASRLQEACAPGSVLVGESTWRRTRDRIDYRRLEPMRLRGLSAPAGAYEAVGPTAGDSRRQVEFAVPLVGRTAEIQTLKITVNGAGEDRNPRLATVVGPPGIGKSRVFAEFALALERGSEPEKVEVLEAHCQAYGLGAAYSPFREVVGSILELDLAGVRTGSGEVLDQIGDGIERLLSRAPQTSEESPGAIADRLTRLLGLATASTDAADGEEGSGARRNRWFSAMRTVLEAAASERTLVVGIEDLQWADEGTLDLVEYLTRWLEAPVVFVCMAREELIDRHPDWGGGRRRATTIRLDPLDEDRTRTLVSSLLGASDESEVVVRLSGRCEGNPLFAEEMVSQVLELGPGGIAELPESVQAVLDTRLDALDLGERRLIHHAAVVGVRFWDGALERLAVEAGIDLAAGLERLAELDLISPAGASRLPRSREFRFRHALIQEVAYSRLPKADRAHKHVETAAFLEEQEGEPLIAMTARHYASAVRAGEQAELDEEFLLETGKAARRTLEAAGDAAAAVFASGEAEERYEIALRIAESSGAERVRILEKLGDVALRGGRATRAVEAWEQALALAAEAVITAEHTARLHRKLGVAERQRGERRAAIGHAREGIDLLRGAEEASLELARLYGDAATLYMDTGENLLAIYAAEKSLTLAEAIGDSSSASRAYTTFGRAFGRNGDQVKARANLELAIGKARESDPADLLHALLAFGAHLATAEQRLEPAAVAFEEALEIARRLGTVPEQIELEGAIARLAARRGDVSGVVEATEAGEALTDRAELSGLTCFSRLTRGWIQWSSDEGDALGTLRDAEAGAREIGRMDVAFDALLLQGWAHHADGRFRDADEAFEAALAVCERTGLLAQSVEVSAARAINLAREGSADTLARRRGTEARATAERLGLTAAVAAAVEASGATDPDPAAAAETLEEASRKWRELGQPLAGLRAQILKGWRLLEQDAATGLAVLAEAESESTALGAVPLARDARRIAEKTNDAGSEG